MMRRTGVGWPVVLLALGAAACAFPPRSPSAPPARTEPAPLAASEARLPPLVIAFASGFDVEANALALAFAAAHPGSGQPAIEPAAAGGQGMAAGDPGPAAGEPPRFVLSPAPPAGAVARLRFSAHPAAPQAGDDEVRLVPGSPFVLAAEPTPQASPGQGASGQASPAAGPANRTTLTLAPTRAGELTGPAREFWQWASAHGQAAIDAAPRATLAVVGDLQLARGLETKIARHGVGYPLEYVEARLKAADLTVANLESPLGRKGKPLPGKGIWFRARPEAVDVLARGGVDAVAVANNHILDYDTENFLETLGLLRDAGVRVVGGGEDLTAARRPVLLEAKGIRVALLAYSQFADIVFSYAYPRAFAATDNRPGVAPLRPELVAADVAAARRLADVVAVMVHWGDEYQNRPNAQQVEWAHAFVDAGADLVLGFHPHAIQGFEAYQHGLIAYSLGNFVMDQWDPVTVESMLLEIALTRGDDGKVRVGPVRVAPVGIRDFRPQLLAGPERDRLWRKMQEISGRQKT